MAVSSKFIGINNKDINKCSHSLVAEVDPSLAEFLPNRTKVSRRKILDSLKKMPSKRKSLMFASACFTSICSFVIICLVLATKNWVSSKISFSSGTVNTTLIYRYGLFEGHLSTTVVNGITKPESSFQVADSLNNGTVKSLNIMIIFLLVLSLLSSFLSAGFTCYNAVSNPYQTFLGPIGVYTWNSISGFCIFLTLILFAVNVEANELSVELAFKTTPSPPSRPYKLSNSYGYSYWIMLLIVFLNVATIIIIVFYQKARYSKRKEQQRPMESAPKDGILF